MVEWWRLDISKATPSAAVDTIERVNQHWLLNWSDVDGWAPGEVTSVLGKCRLDRQVGLSRMLRLWLSPGDENESEARLILAWANLGALVEGSLKFFLVVFLHDYVRHADDTFLPKKPGSMDQPEALMLQSLRCFFAERVWTTESMWLDGWIKAVQYRRNAIHAFRDRAVGTHEEFVAALTGYCELLRELDMRLPERQ